MALTGRRLSGAHYRATTRAVKDQPDGPLHRPGNEGVDQHSKHGREFKDYAAERWRANQEDGRPRQDTLTACSA